MAVRTSTSTGTAASNPAKAGGMARAADETAPTQPVTTSTRTPTSTPPVVKDPFITSDATKDPFSTRSRPAQASSSAAPTGAPTRIPAAMSCAAEAP